PEGRPGSSGGCRVNVYLAHFSFDLRADADPFTDGHCTAIVEAANAAAALEKFREVLRDMKTREALFEPVQKVYLDSCSEMIAAPRDALITFVQLSDQDGGSIDRSNLAATRLAVTAFSLGEDEDPPFIEFE